MSDEVTDEEIGRRAKALESTAALLPEDSGERKAYHTDAALLRELLAVRARVAELEAAQEPCPICGEGVMCWGANPQRYVCDNCGARFADAEAQFVKFANEQEDTAAEEARKLLAGQPEPGATDLDALIRQVGEWAERTFPKSTSKSILAHLRRELDELEDQPFRVSEWADCMILLLHYAHKMQIMGTSAIKDKFAVIQNRDYTAEPDEEGVVEHNRNDDQPEPAGKTERHIQIRFDGPPGPVAGCFVDAEDETGKSIGGKWVHDGDYWLLVFPDLRESEHLRERVAELEAQLKVKGEK